MPVLFAAIACGMAAIALAATGAHSYPVAIGAGALCVWMVGLAWRSARPRG